jgi:hypothetical protein
MKTSAVSFGDGLTIVVGDRAARLTPSQGFSVAQRLMRRATTALVVEQAQHEMRQRQMGRRTISKRIRR